METSTRTPSDTSTFEGLLVCAQETRFCKEKLPPIFSNDGLSPLSTDHRSTNDNANGNNDAHGKNQRPNPRPSFKSVGNSIRLSLRIVQGFATLRDMGGTYIHPCELKTVRKLGEGAFAVVEEALYSPDPTSQDPNAAGGVCGGAAMTAPSAGPGPGVSRRVAVKRLKPEIVDHEGDLEAFMKEAALMRKFANKRIVEFVGVGSQDASSEDSRQKTMYLVQEFMDGGTLRKLVSRQMVDMGKWLYSYDDAFRWAVQMAEGLEYLHSARPMIIHRDLKLENILLKGTKPATADAKIADFGLVAIVRPRPREQAERLQQADSLQLQMSISQSRASTLRLVSLRRRTPSQTPRTVQDLWNSAFTLAQTPTTTGARCIPPQQLSGRTGSYMYMAPEMYLERQYNEKVDVFSYGVILFELFARYMMICAVSVAGTEEEIESYAAKVSEGYRPPLPAKWPQPIRELIARCWHQDPAERPSMSWVRTRLQELQAEGVPATMQLTLTAPVLCGCTVM